MNHKKGVIAMTILTAYVFCGASTPTTQGCNTQNTGSIGPSKGEVVAVGVAVGAVVVVGTVIVIYEVNDHHHTIKGCATLTPDGIQVIDERDKRTYTVTGVTADVKPGDRVKVHGNKEKQQKGSTAPTDFVVQKINKNYGPCTTPPVTTPAVSNGNE